MIPPLMAAVPWGDLHICFMLDYPNQLHWVSVLDVQRWGQPMDQLVHTALINLSTHASQARVHMLPREETVGFEVWTVATEPYLVNAMVLLQEVLDQVPIPLDEMFLLIPDRSVLYLVRKPTQLERRLELTQIGRPSDFEGH